MAVRDHFRVAPVALLFPTDPLEHSLVEARTRPSSTTSSSSSSRRYLLVRLFFLYNAQTEHSRNIVTKSIAAATSTIVILRSFGRKLKRQRRIYKKKTHKNEIETIKRDREMSRIDLLLVATAQLFHPSG